MVWSVGSGCPLSQFPQNTSTFARKFHFFLSLCRNFHSRNTISLRRCINGQHANEHIIPHVLTGLGSERFLTASGLDGRRTDVLPPPDILDLIFITVLRRISSPLSYLLARRVGHITYRAVQNCEKILVSINVDRFMFVNLLISLCLRYIFLVETRAPGWKTEN